MPDFHLSLVRTRPGGNHEIEIFHSLCQLALAEACSGQPFCLLYLSGRDIFQNSQNFFCSSACNTQNSSGVYALHTAGIRHSNTLYIFNNIAAAGDRASLRHHPQNLSYLCAGIGDGDGLCAAESGNKFSI